MTWVSSITPVVGELIASAPTVSCQEGGGKLWVDPLAWSDKVKMFIKAMDNKISTMGNAGKVATYFGIGLILASTKLFLTSLSC